MAKKIKLVHIISILQLGGAEAVLLSLIEQLGFDDYEHHVIYFHSGPSVTRMKERGIPVYQIQGAVLLGDPLFWVRLYKLIKSLRPDLIHTHLWAANLAGRVIGRLLDIRVVNTIHNKLVYQGVLRNLIDSVSMPLADAVVGIGPIIVSSGKRWPYDEKKITCIPNGIDAHAIQQRALHEQVFREQLGWSSGHVVIGTVGRFEDQKNYHTLISAFAQVHAKLPQTRLLLVGGGSLEQSLRAHAQLLGVDDVVQFVVGKSAYGYYPVMDIFVLASHYEGLSIALLEAISCGVPCITTGNNGTHELIKTDETGMLVFEPTVEAVERAIFAMLGSPDARKKMSEHARALIETKYGLAKMATSYIHLYGNLLKKNVEKVTKQQ